MSHSGTFDNLLIILVEFLYPCDGPRRRGPSSGAFRRAFLVAVDQIP